MATLYSAATRSVPHVLIMDECVAVRDLLHDALRLEGYRVTAWHGLLDLVDVASLQPDVIIMEQWFAGSVAASRMFLRQLRQEPTLAHVPVVLSTTCLPHGQATQAARELQAAGIHLLPKPYAINDLLAHLQDRAAPVQAHRLVPRPRPCLTPSM